MPVRLRVELDKVSLTPLPPEEAMTFFHGKILLSSKKFYSLVNAARVRAFTVSRVAKMEIIDDIRSAVQAAIDNGETLADFMSRLGEVMDEKGWGGLTPWHAETVFRTNIQTSYSVQHEEQYRESGDAFPLAEYEATMDDRVRDEHAEMDGKIYPVDDPFWDTWTPPNGFNCRCSKRYIHKYEAEERGLKASDPPPAGIMPDKGFDVNPVKSIWQPNPEDYPRELWVQYEREQNEKQ